MHRSGKEQLTLSSQNRLLHNSFQESLHMDTEEHLPVFYSEPDPGVIEDKIRYRHLKFLK
ncbi:hypothetical protein [Ferviditalea candida]|uniref:Uncharacterized protein n=1 Tax=Ferviditalea candida TaxID=3108399 RepID=A0ABU5ZHM7_9BACL|nr:hypothetical protein [Paenibacillaceae bacterium T2]